MNKMRGLFAVAVAFVCAGMWGCGNSDYVHWDKRLNGVLVALVDDSLALLTNYRKFEDCHEIFMGSDECNPGITNDGLFLVNYRKKRTPLWGDTLKEHISIVYGFWRDSSALFSNEEEKFGFWKIGEEPRVVGKWKCEAPCRCGSAKYGHPWKNGNILLKMVQQDECPYAILDTATGDVKKLEFTGELAWLKGCDDITYIDGDVVCLRALYAENRYGVYKYVNNEFSDSLIWQNAFWSEYTKNVLEIRGNMFTVKHPTETVDFKTNALNGTFIHSILPFETPKFPVRIEYNTFIDSFGNSISYSSEDLIVTK